MAKGHGEVNIKWKPLHYNSKRFADAKQDERFLTMLNTLEADEGK